MSSLSADDLRRVVEHERPGRRRARRGDAMRRPYSFPLAVPTRRRSRWTTRRSAGRSRGGDSKLGEARWCYWFPPFSVTLRPNEYRVYQGRGGDVTRSTPGPSSVWVPSPTRLEGDDGRKRLPDGVERQAGGPVTGQHEAVRRRRSTTREHQVKPRQKVRARFQGTATSADSASSTTWAIRGSRSTIWALRTRTRIRRTTARTGGPIRWGTIYKKDAATKPKVWGRVLPSEWPDGGHDSEFGSTGFFTERRQTGESRRSRGSSRDCRHRSGKRRRCGSRMPDASSA